ncbi:MAG: LytTR family DNA-binding domain-containing protein [Hymenobacter sp.]
MRAVQKAQALLPAAAPPALPPARAKRASRVRLPLFVKGDSKNKYLKLNYADILYIQGLKNYVSIVVLGQRIITYLTLRELAAQLPQPPFVRVHKSFIISLDHLRLVDGHTLHVGQEEILVGDTYREDFFRLIREKG